MISGDLDLRSSTVSGNQAQFGAGVAFQGSGSARLHDATVTLNTASRSTGGLSVGASGPFEVRNTLVADIPGGDCGIAGTSTFSPVGVNLHADGSCAGFTVQADPGLGSLADNGGATMTHLPRRGSPAIDRGMDCLPQD